MKEAVSIVSDAAEEGSTLHMLQIGVLLLGCTMLAEMYFQNRGVEMLRAESGLVAEETIDMLLGNIEYRDPIDEQVIRELGRYRSSGVSKLNVSTPGFDTRKEECLADLRVCDLEVESPLHLAAAKGQVEVVKFLLETGHDANIRSRDVHFHSINLYTDTLQTPLHYASASGNVEVMRLLLDHGGDIYAKTENGDTALHKAALHGHTSAVRWLLDHGADLETKNVFEATPLSMALVNQRKEVAVVLLVQRKSKNTLPSMMPWIEEIQSSPMLLLLEAFILLMFMIINSRLQVRYYPSFMT